MPNSLIFAVILAVWAAYLIQHWIRRRDHVATAKSVDRFSEAMRVLERRQATAPRADLTAPTPKSYAVSLTRPAHPDVVVKRARHGADAPERRRTRRRIPRPSATTLRALLLIVGVLALAAGITVYALALAPWWSAAAGGAGFLLAVTIIRFSVGRQRRRAASPVRATSRPELAREAVRPQPARATSGRSRARRRRAARSADRPQAGRGRKRSRRRAARRRPAAVSAPAGARVEEPGTVDPTVEQPVARHESSAQGAPDVDRAAAVADGEAAVADAPQFFDVEAHEPPRVAPVASVGTDRAVDGAVDEADSEVPVELEPGTWAPVPVPPPTYTLKARATRPGSPAPAGARIEDLPFDGHALAFDEEFEDLPPVHSVG